MLTGAGDEAFCAGADLGAGAFEFDYATPTIAYADLLRTALSMSFEEAIAFGEGQIGLLAMTQDAREGITAFKDKEETAMDRQVNKVALVTGANKGLGFEIARQLGQKGVTVVLGARDDAKAKAAADKLKAEGVDAHGVKLDVTDEI